MTGVATVRRLANNPATTLIVCLLGGSAFALAVVLQFEGHQRAFLLTYFLPIGLPFIALIIERLAHASDDTPRRHALDVAVILLALLRAGIWPIPYISGHVLFLTYAITTARTRLLHWMAVAVMAQVLWLKLVAWRSLTTAIETAVGIGVALAAAWLWRRWQQS